MPRKSKILSQFNEIPQPVTLTRRGQAGGVLTVPAWYIRSQREFGTRYRLMIGRSGNLKGALLYVPVTD